MSLQVPKIFNLRTDPYERADITSNTNYDWLLNHVYLLTPAQDYVGKFLMSFKEYLQRQKAASFNLDEVLDKPKEAPAKYFACGMHLNSAADGFRQTLAAVSHLESGAFASEPASRCRSLWPSSRSRSSQDPQASL